MKSKPADPDGEPTAMIDKQAGGKAQVKPATSGIDDAGWEGPSHSPEANVRPGPTPRPAEAGKPRVPAPAKVGGEGSPKPARATANLVGGARPDDARDGSGPESKAGKTPDPAAASDAGPPSSKPRLARVSMDLGGVFNLPPADEEMDVPVDVDDSPAFEEEIEPEPDSISLLQKLPQPEGPRRPPPPKLLRPDAPIVPAGRDAERAGIPGLAAPALAMVEDEAQEEELPKANLFAPVALPSSPLSDLAALEPVENIPAILTAGAEDTTPPTRRAKGASSGLLIALAAVGLIVLVGGGVLMFRGGGDEPAVAAVTPEPDETAPAETSQPKPAATAENAPETAETAAPPETAAAPAETAPASKATAAGAPGTALAPKAAGEAPESAPPSPLTGTKPPAATPTATTAAPPEPTATAAPPNTTPKPPTPPSTGAAFNKSAAAASINSLKGAAQGCKQPDGPQGHARVSITFAPTGRVTVAQVNGPPFAGTPVGGCIAAAFRSATVPPFEGSVVTVHTSVAIF